MGLDERQKWVMHGQRGTEVEFVESFFFFLQLNLYGLNVQDK